jgi:hypothetical protein
MLNRRDALRLAGAGIAGFLLPDKSWATDRCEALNFGVYPTINGKAPKFRRCFPSLRRAGEASKVLLWKYFESITGKPLEPHYQGNVGNVDGEGDCVAQAFGLGVDILTATEILLHKEREKWINKSSVEMIYAGSRVEIGKNKLNGKGGSLGEWAADYLQQYGVLHRVKYDQLDLTGYDPARSRKYRDIGVPDDLEPIAKEHPVQEHSKVADFDAACDALSGGQPIVVCCTYAPVRDRNGIAQRDQNGFIQMDTGGSYRRGRRWFSYRDKWYHAWLIAGCDTESDQPGLYFINSHGKNWIDGPQPDGIPDGGFKLSPEHANLMIKDWGEAYAISAYKGHPGNRVHKLKKHKLYR